MDINGIMKNKINKNSTIRDVLQILGTNLLRNEFNNNIHIAATLGSIKKEENIIITDLRFKNEKKCIEELGGITIRVNRPCVYDTNGDGDCGIGICKCKQLQHPSETELDNETFKYVIDNNGTIGDLIEKVREILIKENIIK